MSNAFQVADDGKEFGVFMPMEELYFKDANEAHALCRVLNEALDKFKISQDKKIAKNGKPADEPKAKKLTKKKREAILAQAGKGVDAETIAGATGFPVERIQEIINQAKGE